MPRPHKTEAEIMPILVTLEVDEAEAVHSALGLAIDHYTRKAEEQRGLSERAMTISHRRQAHARAMDLTAHARKLDALRARFTR